MSIRTLLSLTLATTLGVVGMSYAQQAGSGTAQQETPSATLQQQQQQRDVSRDQGPTSTTRSNQDTGRVERSAGFRASTAQDASRSRTLRLSEIEDVDVYNLQNEELGEVEDIVIDAQEGKVRYLAVSVGGFLGIGDRLVAIPWESFRQQKDEDGDLYLVLNIDRERLENAPGFNEDNWPDFANERYSQEIDQYYSSDRDSTRTSTTSGTTQSTTNQSTVPGTQNRTQPQGQQSPQ